ncbi:hypothetical protein I5S53_07290 [Pseudomonas juntendi]|jgi:hypothetical protein|uniref:hypothetical protein n=1 Tax=Pseudomonas TaxID=286 RepID=UPI000760D731|nr:MULTISPECIES: hypothetical protein [Pseudomonas]MBH3383776.1 hypothetical protein [Pseudomonas juntendi]MCE0778196.1 hypothetical protein [Pseudomonas sp. NMI542_15]
MRLLKTVQGIHLLGILLAPVGFFIYILIMRYLTWHMDSLTAYVRYGSNETTWAIASLLVGWPGVPVVLWFVLGLKGKWPK